MEIYGTEQFSYHMNQCSRFSSQCKRGRDSQEGWGYFCTFPFCTFQAVGLKGGFTSHSTSLNFNLPKQATWINQFFHLQSSKILLQTWGGLHTKMVSRPWRTCRHDWQMQNEVLFWVYKEGTDKGAWLTVRVCRAETQASGADCFTDAPKKEDMKANTASEPHQQPASRMGHSSFSAKSPGQACQRCLPSL